MGVFTHTHIRPEKEVQEQIQSLFNSMKDIYVSDDERIFELFAYLMKYLSDAPVINKIETDISNRIKSICTYIDSNYAEISGIKSVAKEFYISEAYLCRSFKKVMGSLFSISYENKTEQRNKTAYKRKRKYIENSREMRFSLLGIFLQRIQKRIWHFTVPL